MAKNRPVRGATLNQESSRFNLPAREADGDWLDARAALDDAPPPLRTTVTVERARTIITRNQSPDIAFDRSINPYRGCEHGCIYCFARPTHAYLDLSPGLDFESRLFAKPDAPALLRAELGKRGYVCRPIAFGTNTDPYQPIEAEWRITRGCIEVLAEQDHPLTITTKSNRVTRDLDLLAPMARKGLAAVMISVTSLDPRIAMTVEPRAPHPEKRLAAMRQLADAGVPVFVSLAPVIPQVTDHEIERILERAAEAGARTAFFLPVRLPHEVARCAFPRSRRQGDGDDPVDPRRQGQRPRFPHALPGPGALGGTAADAVPDGGETPWAGPGSAATADGPVPAAQGGAGGAVLAPS